MKTDFLQSHSGNLLPTPPSPPMIPARLPPNPRIWKRRRLKYHPPKMSVSIEGLFRGIISAFPSVNSLDLIVPALGFASGAAMYASSSRRNRRLEAEAEDPVAGDWVLFGSPTPFNRSVLLRCPTISSSDGVNQGLVEEDRHLVALNKGRIPLARQDGEVEEDIVYQRVCVNAEDGGVIALDWPENLDFEKEVGLDTTVLLVPGMAEGSWSRDVKVFVRESLRHGYFPVVMNPRGCAGSPVTTPRLFTAADSDDVRTTVQFIKQSRPWASLMSVGWGYGSNMLTKYLGESGDLTSITASVCINNPFDMDEISQTHSHNNAVLDQVLLRGLVDILQANKEVFQGKNKGFHVEKALSATSIREFNRAISMISYGSETIGAFYSNCDTRQSISSIKIPVLFLQDNQVVPYCFIPCKAVAENPFTSLLMCSCLTWNNTTHESSASRWCQDLVVEWLQAVELALLKGRHPLIKVMDIPLNPANDLPVLETRISGNSIDGKYPSVSENTGDGKHRSKLPKLDNIDRYSRNSLAYMIDKCNNYEDVDKGVLKPDNAVAPKKEGDFSNHENGQALETATVVLNMLDVTMPGSLNPEQKRKVLTAVDQGETLLKALEGAVPEDIRGKLTNSISEIVTTQRAELNFDRLKKLGWGSNLFDLKSKIQQSLKGASGVDVNKLHNQQKSTVNDEIVADSAQLSSDGSSTIAGENITSQGKKIQNYETVVVGQEKESESSKINEAEENTTIKEDINLQNTTQSDKVGQHLDDEHVIAEENNDINRDKLKTETESYEQVSPADADTNILPKKVVKDVDNKREAEKGQIKVGQNASMKSESAPLGSSSINVSEALDAFRSFDDSTQMAVNSVFGVIENMIDQLEKKSDENMKEVNQEMGSEATQESIVTDSKYQEYRDKNFKPGVEEDVNNDQRVSCSGTPSGDNKKENAVFISEFDSQVAESKKLLKSSDSFSSIATPSIKLEENEESIPKIVDNTSMFIVDASNEQKNKNVQKYPLQLLAKTNWEMAYNAHLQKYLSLQLSHIRSTDARYITDVFLDNEKGQWKLTSQLGNGKFTLEETTTNKRINGQGQNLKACLPIRDNGKDPESCEQKESNLEPVITGIGVGEIHSSSSKKREVKELVWKTILDTLTIEAKRSLGILDTDIKLELASDLEKVADAVSCAILQDNNNISLVETEDSSKKFGIIEGQFLINAISSAVQNANHLRGALPIGVIIGSILASLHKYFDIANENNDKQDEHNVDVLKNINGQGAQGSDIRRKRKKHINGNNFAAGHTKQGNVESHVGALTAVICASTILAYNQQRRTKEANERISDASDGVEDTPKGTDDVYEELKDAHENDMVSSIAEKTMSVAAPIVPIKSDGKFDLERLMSILAELGRKGGLLRFFGNIALLWGGVRGAMSLTDRLIHFLRIAERPLFYRIFSFIFMLLVMWSPVLVPLLPKIVQCWTAKISFGTTAYASVAGLHVATFILIMLWGKRIRKYEFPLKQYGLDLSSTSKGRDFLKGLMGGCMFVLLVHLLNALLGHARFVCPSLPSLSADASTLMKAHGKLLSLFIGGSTTAFSVAIVEELLFRSWLPNEISVDLGDPLAIVLSGLAFALFQRSLSSIPGFLFLSLALFGAKQRDNGSLYIPIGIRSGMILTSFLIQNGGLVTYKPSTPFWLTSTHSWHPFDGAVGIICCIVLATLFYPKQPVDEDNVSTNGQNQKGDA